MRELAEKVQTQALAIDEINMRHSEQMSTLIGQLKAEQKEINDSIEERLEKMRDMSLSAQVSAQSLDAASTAGRQTVEALAQSASLADEAVKQRFAQMEDIVAYSSAKAESIGERAAERVRDSLSLTRMEIGRIENDMQALETQISQNLSSNNSPVDITPQPSNSKLGWRKSLLRLRPIDESKGRVSSALNLVPLTDKAADIDADDETSSDTELPSAPVIESAKQDLPFNNIGNNIGTDTSNLISEDASLISDEISDETSGGISGGDIEANINADALEARGLVDDVDLSLDMEHNIDLEIPDPDKQLRQEASDIVSAAQIEAPLRKKVKRGWSWKTMLGGIKTDVFDANLTAETTQSDKVTSLSSPANIQASGAFISAQLGKIGLSPNAVIDDGCISECVNIGQARGLNAMQDIVALRLTGPVQHLREKLEIDRDLANHVRAYANDFHSSISPYQADRDALYTLLDSENGRAFLLSEAALKNSRD